MYIKKHLEKKRENEKAFRCFRRDGNVLKLDCANGCTTLYTD